MRILENRIPPPLIGLAIGALMGWIAVHAPDFAWPVRAPAAAAMVVAVFGFGIALSGVLAFRKARTTVNPLDPTKASAIVTDGIYRRTRNPMYLGMLILLCGWAVFLSNTLALLPLPLFVLYINRFQIAPEERALQGLFGAEFEAYRQRVRRWL